MSQSEILNEKILSGKEGTVTEAGLKNPNNNYEASTKYVDDSEKNSVPQGIKSASIVHHLHKSNGDEVVKEGESDLRA